MICLILNSYQLALKNKREDDKRKESLILKLDVRQGNLRRAEMLLVACKQFLSIKLQEKSISINYLYMGTGIQTGVL